jgi:hypothetical protein
MADGRLMLEAWKGKDGEPIMSDLSWLPKPYEIIGSLDPVRRQVYFERNRSGGWLVHDTSIAMGNFDARLAEVLAGRRIEFQKELGPWIVYRISPRGDVRNAD